MNRRQFLRGVGGAALALPVLSSLLPRSARAAGEPALRYIQFANTYSPSPAMWFGNLAGAQQIAPNVSVSPLSSAPASLTPVLGSAFDAVRSKMSVLRGLNVQANNPNHNVCMPTCASGYSSGLDGDGFPPEANNESVDVVLGKSSKVYATPVALTRRWVNIYPRVGSDNYASGSSFSWQRSGNGVEIVPPITQTNALLNLFASSFGMVTMPADLRERSLLQAVHGDYTRLRQHPRLSSADRTKLDAYIALISDLEKEAATVPATTCQGPTTEPGTTYDALVRTQLRVIAAAMACDLTRVASVRLSFSANYDERHENGHHRIVGLGGGYSVPQMLSDFQSLAGNVAWFVKHLDSIADSGGTLLDNSIVYWGMQYGCTTGDDVHRRIDMPVVVAGGAGGRLAQGRFYDFRANNAGLVLNNLMVTFFNAMGLSSSDYESGGTGYGLYTSNGLSGRPDASSWTSATGKRSPLPGFYIGPTRG